MDFASTISEAHVDQPWCDRGFSFNDTEVLRPDQLGEANARSIVQQSRDPFFSNTTEAFGKEKPDLYHVDAISCAIMSIWVAKNPGVMPQEHTISCLSLALGITDELVERWFRSFVPPNLHGITPVLQSSSHAQDIDHLTQSVCNLWMMKNLLSIPEGHVMSCLAHVFSSSVNAMRQWFAQNTWNFMDHGQAYSTTTTQSESDTNASSLPGCVESPTTADRWAKIIQELQSDPTRHYTCTFGCHTKFKTKGSWTRHERENRLLEFFQCPFDGCPMPLNLRNFSRRHRFTDHLKKYHQSSSLNPQQISTCRATLPTQVSMDCLFDGCAFAFPDWDVRVSHYEWHFNELRNSTIHAEGRVYGNSIGSDDDDDDDDNEGESNRRIPSPGHDIHSSRTNHTEGSSSSQTTSTTNDFRQGQQDWYHSLKTFFGAPIRIPRTYPTVSTCVQSDTFMFLPFQTKLNTTTAPRNRSKHAANESWSLNPENNVNRTLSSFRKHSLSLKSSDLLKIKNRTNLKKRYFDNNVQGDCATPNLVPKSRNDLAAFHAFVREICTTKTNGPWFIMAQSSLFDLNSLVTKLPRIVVKSGSSRLHLGDILEFTSSASDSEQQETFYTINLKLSNSLSGYASRIKVSTSIAPSQGNWSISLPPQAHNFTDQSDYFVNDSEYRDVPSKSLGQKNFLESDRTSSAFGRRLQKSVSGKKSLYRPLNTSSTRLLNILPGAAGEPLKCTLVHNVPLDISLGDMKLGDEPLGRVQMKLRYEVLSYLWGSQESDQTIQVAAADNDTVYVPMDITMNLLNALHRLRHAKAIRTMWIDSLCINQEDIAEIKQQIIQMDRIFVKADSVIIWIDEDNQSYAATTLIQDLHLRPFRSICFHFDYSLASSKFLENLYMLLLDTFEAINLEEQASATGRRCRQNDGLLSKRRSDVGVINLRTFMSPMPKILQRMKSNGRIVALDDKEENVTSQDKSRTTSVPTAREETSRDTVLAHGIDPNGDSDQNPYENSEWTRHTFAEGDPLPSLDSLGEELKSMLPQNAERHGIVLGRAYASEICTPGPYGADSGSDLSSIQEWQRNDGEVVPEPPNLTFASSEYSSRSTASSQKLNDSVLRGYSPSVVNTVRDDQSEDIGEDDQTKLLGGSLDKTGSTDGMRANERQKYRSGCDGCYLAGRRCSGGSPCSWCRASNFLCIYSLFQQVDRPKGPRSVNQVGKPNFKEKDHMHTSTEQVRTDECDDEMNPAHLVNSSCKYSDSESDIVLSVNFRGNPRKSCDSGTPSSEAANLRHFLGLQLD